MNRTSESYYRESLHVYELVYTEDSPQIVQVISYVYFFHRMIITNVYEVF